MAYIQRKTQTSVGNWTAYLNNVGLEGLLVETFVPLSTFAVPGVTVPLIAFAASGGAERAMLVGGGIMAAFDGRNQTGVDAKVGGVLGLAQYFAGLSGKFHTTSPPVGLRFLTSYLGGSWLAGSYALANFITFEELRDEVWDLVEDIFLPRSDSPTEIVDIAATLAAKAETGAPVSFVDPYGRLLAYHLFNDTRTPPNGTNGPGAATLWSSIKQTPKFLEAIVPFPIILSLGRAPAEDTVSIASPYEMTPYTFGTDLPSSGGLSVPIEFLGTNFTNGSPANASTCVTGFQNAGFLMGCSGNFLGVPVQIFIQQAIQGSPEIMAVLDESPDRLVLDGRVVNPFRGLASDGFPATNNTELFLLDGGFAGGIPFFPLLQPSRRLDVIIAIDALDEINNYPAGNQMRITYEQSLQPNYPPFPEIPRSSSFVAQGLNVRPVFFGSSCYPQPGGVETPLVVYLPNYFEVYPTNTASTQPSYSVEEQQGFYDNGYAIATQNGSSTWPSCLACALIDAQQARNGAARSSQCSDCFSRYCYLGEP
ncbi:hypothetical protein RQP46_003884 [Phenoliferia psychrophenolica]